MIKTPACDKMASVADRSQDIGEFLDWLQHEKLIELCIRHDICGKLMACRNDTERLLAEYFGIDLKKVEEERRAIVDALRRK